ncbi:hypothetical protein [Nakamurella endophytica]|uniref:Type II secretion system protein GspF domain-containing protein n=1 Tax=Nakamurella endophytica TaxID=1748367 RepID=A0A917WHH5_9ACTN|nr:hypothetical protein [Nakamurella endophytica]GGM05345.1 hypothetical protein GCM10011594_26960 [Nakamurella endophytica]
MTGDPGQIAGCAALLLGALGLWAWPGPAAVARRRVASSRHPALPVAARRAAWCGAGLLGAGLVTGLPALLVATAAVAVAGVLLRMPVRPGRVQRNHERAELAVHADLLAACLDAGMAVGPALLAIAEQVGPAGRGTVSDPGDRRSGSSPSGGSPELDRVPRPDGSGLVAADRAAHRRHGRQREPRHGRRPDARGVRWRARASPSAAAGGLARPAALLRRWAAPDRDAPVVALSAVGSLYALGASAAVAWTPADVDAELAGLAAAARRSAAGGTVLADAVREHAAELRRRMRQDAEQAAARGAIAMTGPLAVCFLPAFLCLGLAPVVVGLLGTLGIG